MEIEKEDRKREREINTFLFLIKKSVCVLCVHEPVLRKAFFKDAKIQYFLIFFSEQRHVRHVYPIEGRGEMVGACSLTGTGPGRSDNNCTFSNPLNYTFSYLLNHHNFFSV